MITIPSPNPIQNSAIINYEYNADSVTVIPSQAITNLAETQVNIASLGMVKYASKTYVKLNDTIDYTVVFENYGNVTAEPVVFIDTIPVGLQFQNGTVQLNGNPISGDPNSGVTIPNIDPFTVSTITFTVDVVSLPSPSSIANQAISQYSFIVDPSLPAESDTAISNVETGFVYQATINAPDGGFEKYASPSYADIGDTITYSVVIENTGNVTADNIVFIDTIPSGTTFIQDSVYINGVQQIGENPNPPTGITLGNIAPGSVNTITFKVLVITIPTINPISNTATAEFTFIVDPSLPAISASGNSTSATAQVNSANFSNSGIITYVDKEFVQVNGLLNYTVVFTNTGNVTAINTFIVNSLPVGTSFVANSLILDGVAMPGQSTEPPTGLSVGDIAAGQVSTITYQLLVNTIPTINPIEVQSIANYKYTVDPSNPLVDGSNISNIVYTTVNQANIDNGNGGFNKYVSKDYVSTDEIITYTIVIKNTGNVDATNVIIVDTIPQSTVLVPNSVILNGVALPGQDPSPPTGINIGTVPAGATTTLTFDVQVSTIPTSTPISNSASATFDFAIIPTIPNSGSSSGNSNVTSSVISAAVIDAANGGFTKIASKEYADLSDIITYTFVLENTGNATANNVILIDTIPYGLEFIDNTVKIVNTIPGENPNVGINIGVVNPNQIITVSFLVEVVTIPTINPILNNASVVFNYTSDPSIPNGNSSSGESTTVMSQINNANFSAALGGLNKTATPQYCKIGDTVTYTIVIENKGTVDAINTIVIDTLPENTEFIENSLALNGVSQVGATVEPPTGLALGTVPVAQVNTITFQVVVVSLPATNTMSNTVYIGYDYTTDPSIPNGQKGGNIFTGGQNEVNMAIIDKDSGYTKYVDKQYASIYKNITYTIAVKNSGNVTATNVQLYDTLPYGIIFAPGTVYIDNVNLVGANPTIAPGIVIGNIAANSTSTVQFKVYVTTIPTPNPFYNTSNVTYNYTTDPLIIDGESASSDSNSVATKVNGAIFAGFNGTFPKYVNGQSDMYSTINEILVYSTNFTNIGNENATNVMFKDTIPQGTTFINNSVMINGVTVPSSNPEMGINLGTILPDETTTISFQVLVNSIPDTNTIVNSASLEYNFTSDPLNPNGESGRDLSDETTSILNYALINGDGFKKYQDKEFTEIGDTIMYTIIVKNTGVTTANSVMFYDTIPVGTQYISGSVTVNGVPVNGNPELGIGVGNLAPNVQTTITFVVQVVSLPTNGQVKNKAYVNYSWIVDPTIGNVASTTNYSNETNNAAYLAEITANKISTPNYADLGTTINYAIIMKNTGNVTALNITIIDTIPNNLIYINDTMTIDGVVQIGADPTMSYNVGSINPNTTMTVAFKALVVTLPTLNPTANTMFASYNYIVDPSIPQKSETFTATSNGTVISNANFEADNGGFTKYASRAFVALGDTLTYTLVLTNKGNTAAQNCVIYDTIPQGTTYINGSVLVNGVQSTDNIETGVSLGSILPGVTKTVSYAVLVTTITNNYYIYNNANIDYVYVVDPNDKPVNATNNSTTIESYEKVPIVTITSTSDKNQATIGEKVVYNITIRNTGNTEAKDVLVCVTLANGLIYVDDSTVIAGEPKPSENLVECVTIPNLQPNAIITLSFLAKVVSVPRGGLAINTINANYNYVVDPSLPDAKGNASDPTPPLVVYYNISNNKVIPGNIDCNEKNTGVNNLMSILSKKSTLNCANSINRGKQYTVLGLCSGEDYICINQDIAKYKMWQEHNIDAVIKLPEEVATIDSVEANLTILRSDRVQTPDTEGCSNLEGKKLTGYKQVIEVAIRYTIKFISKNGNLCSDDFYKIFSSFIVINPEYAQSELEVRNCIEDINISKLCGNEITLSTSVILYLIEKTTASNDCSDFNEGIGACISNSNICNNVATFMKPCHKYWNEFNICTQECTDRYDIGDLVSVNAFISSLEFDNINTPISNMDSYEGLATTGNMLLVSFTIDAKVTYVSNDGSNSLRQISLIIPASSYIVVDADSLLTFCAVNRYDVTVCIEDIYVCNLDCKNLFTNTTLIIKADEYTPLPLNCKR